MSSPFETTERKPLTAQQRAKLFLEAGGKCSVCSRKLRPGDKWQDDHKVALMNGGTNEWANRRVICDWCHKPKTVEDHGLAAKARAVATKFLNFGRVRKGRPMPGTRDSLWRKRLDGTTERR